MKPRLLDLFCGAGGASMGYHRAGFDVVGVDIKPQPNYPFEFHQADALTFPLDGFDAIAASPPCQAYSVLRRANPEAQYVELIPVVRERLLANMKPYIIENVPGAPLLNPVILCGSMFGLGAGNRQLRRHRLFESNVLLMRKTCSHMGEAIGVYGGGPTGRYTFANRAKTDAAARRGGYQGTVSEKRQAMGIDWMNGSEINQAIPPAYTEYLGKQLLAYLEKAA